VAPITHAFFRVASGGGEGEEEEDDAAPICTKQRARETYVVTNLLPPIFFLSQMLGRPELVRQDSSFAPMNISSADKRKLDDLLQDSKVRSALFRFFFRPWRIS
jgi:hypothetical protein